MTYLHSHGLVYGTRTMTTLSPTIVALAHRYSPYTSAINHKVSHGSTAPLSYHRTIPLFLFHHRTIALSIHLYCPPHTATHLNLRPMSSPPVPLSHSTVFSFTAKARAPALGLLVGATFFLAATMVWLWPWSHVARSRSGKRGDNPSAWYILSLLSTRQSLLFYIPMLI